jgi:trehalose-6-phosphatase
LIEEEEDFNSAPIFTPGEPLIFLDIDGVLTRHNYDLVAQSNVIESGLVQILNIVLLATNCKIVLSSAWRYITYRNESNIVGLD